VEGNGTLERSRRVGLLDEPPAMGDWRAPLRADCTFEKKNAHKQYLVMSNEWYNREVAGTIRTTNACNRQ
jgi:hypothetical protein